MTAHRENQSRLEGASKGTCDDRSKNDPPKQKEIRGAMQEGSDTIGTALTMRKRNSTFRPSGEPMIRLIFTCESLLPIPTMTT